MTLLEDKERCGMTLGLKSTFEEIFPCTGNATAPPLLSLMIPPVSNSERPQTKLRLIKQERETVEHSADQNLPQKPSNVYSMMPL